MLEADTPEGHDVDGLASLATLEEEHDKLPDTLMGESPTGSPHYYFKHPGNGLKVNCSSSKLAPGVDVKGDGGMVIAPPSVRPGKGVYRWLNDLPIADAPAWLLELVTAGDEPANQSGEGTAPAWKVAAALAAIPNGAEVDRDQWVRIGMAAHAATGGSDAGFSRRSTPGRTSGRTTTKTRRGRRGQVSSPTASVPARCFAWPVKLTLTGSAVTSRVMTARWRSATPATATMRSANAPAT